MTDQELLQQYVRTGEDSALAELVRRHIGWVYPAALRQVRDRHLAEDITQAVFIALAQQAGTLRLDRPISPWLLRVTRCASINALRGGTRRKYREQKAAAMTAESINVTDASDDPWADMAPVLEELVLRLPKTSRQAILLRFYERKSFAEAAQAMGISEDAAQKRTERAVDKLRDMFLRRGVTAAGSVALAAVLTANTSQPANAALLASTTSSALAAAHGVAAAGPAMALAKGAMNMLMWAKVRLLAAWVVGTVAVAGAGTVAGVLVSEAKAPVAQAATQPTTRPDQRYMGWIHIRLERIPEMMQPKGGLRVASSSIHINIAKAIAIKSIEFGTGRTIEWRDGQAQYQAYSSATNELVIDRLPEPLAFPGPTAEPRKNQTPWQLAQELMITPTSDGIAAMRAYGCTSIEREEAGFQRFDLSLPGYSGPDGPPEGQPFSTVLMDKQTKLIHRMSGAFGDYAFTYGAPDYQTIYDVGVPKDAKLVDRREKTSKQAEAMLDRLDARVGVHERFGDYTAIETETIIDRRSDRVEESVTIYARAGDKRLYMKYWNVGEQDLDLQGWPTPGMSLVESSYEIRPSICFVSDGKQGWYAREGSAFRRIADENELQDRSAGRSLSRDLWPSRKWIDYQHTPRLAIEVQVLNNGPQPRMKVIETGWMNVIPGNAFERLEFEWHVDSSRDDLPATTGVKMLKRDGSLVESKQTQFIEYAQLKKGQWYPTLWVEKITSNGQTRTMEHRLQIFPGEQLDAKWFTDPTLRFSKQ